MFGYYLSLKYFPARLSANEGRMTKTVANKSLIRISLVTVSGVFGPPAVMTINIPITPKTMDA